MQSGTDEPGETGDIFVGSKDILVKDILLNRVETIENEMRIHLGLQGLVFHFHHALVELFLLLLTVADLADPKGYEEPDQEQKQEKGQTKEPGGLPPWG